MAKDLQLEYLEKAFDDNAKIKGNLGSLSDKRKVFIGSKEGEKGVWYVAFRNEEGADTYLKLSHEAMAMLMQLYKKHPKGDDIWPLVIAAQWQVTLKEKTE